ncbi:hypothetical protein [Gilvimarinus sp. 1_MG-2023]|nr:hypothetical protein [Gilvimarinus sp. 1_MG-2023]MDO6746970.1 hypothetical protein [Gilvimarinus sp. 1_MG-2023]
MITVFVLQGLLGSVLATPAPEKNAAPERVAVVTDQLVATPCHGHGDMTAEHTKQAENSHALAPEPEHCSGVCCCPGMCTAATLLPSSWILLAVPQQTVTARLVVPLLIAHPSRLYRPPTLV